MLQALDMAAEVDSSAHSLPLYACFNPYFPDEGDLAAEKQRLEQKLRHSGSLIKGIYLQVDDLSALSCSQRASPWRYNVKAGPLHLNMHHLLGTCTETCPRHQKGGFHSKVCRCLWQVAEL